NAGVTRDARLRSSQRGRTVGSTTPTGVGSAQQGYKHWGAASSGNQCVVANRSVSSLGKENSGGIRRLTTNSARYRLSRRKLTPMAIETLRHHRARQAQERLLLGRTGRGGPYAAWDLVFTTEIGTRSIRRT